MGCGCGGFASGGGGTPAAPSSVPTWFPCFAFTFANFTGFAALTGDVQIYSLPDGCEISGAVIKTSQAFAGPGITSVLLSLGLVGDLARYVSPIEGVSAPAGNYFGSGGQLQIENFAAATSIRLAAQSTGANLSVLTAGAGCVYLKVAKVG